MKRSCVACVLAVAAPVSAQVWSEAAHGDAGPLPATAQRCAGAGPLTAITGTSASNDVDMFEIRITDAATFQATTVGGATFDTQLFLFDQSGRGVVINDNDPVGSSEQSRLSSLFVPGPGAYFLAITRYDRDPVSLSNAYLWSRTGNRDAERRPDGSGQRDPVMGWMSTTSGSATYTISLRGAAFVPAGCRADVDGDGLVSVQDFLTFLQRYASGSPDADFNDDGLVSVQDFLQYLSAYSTGCP
jgi:hypothetical protein